MSIAVAIVGILLFAASLALLGLTIASEVTLGLLKRAISTGLLKPGYAKDLEGATVHGRRIQYVTIAATLAAAGSAAILVLAIAFDSSIDDAGKLGCLVMGLVILWAVGYYWMKVPRTKPPSL